MKAAKNNPAPAEYTARFIEAPCLKTLQEGKAVVLLGARQTGKSTLAQAILRDLPARQKLFLNLDDPFLRDRLRSREGALVAAIEEAAGKPFAAIGEFYLVLDEVQKAPELFEILKALYDAHKDHLHLLLTGSSALGIHDPVAESLAGRVRIYEVPPFLLSEAYAHFRGEDPRQGELAGTLLASSMSRLLRGQFTGDDFAALVLRAKYGAAERRAWLESRLRFPLFPEPSKSPEPEEWLRDYLATYLEKDIQSLDGLGNVTLFRNAIRQLAARVGSTFKFETAAQEIGTTSVTLRKYVGLLEQTLNLLRLQPFLVNPVQRVIKAPKLYLRDNGLMWALRGYEDERLLVASGMLGTYFEQAVIVEFAKWCSLEPTSPDLRYWSKTEVSEVDLVISNRGYHIPIEIKLGKTFEKRWLRGLDAFDEDHRRLGVAIPYRLICHLGEPQQIDERTYALPLWMLA